MPGFHWAEAEDNRLRELWPSKLAASEIAQEITHLGMERSGQSVLYRAAFLRLPRRGPWHCRAWAAEEDSIIRELWPKGVPSAEIAKRLPMRTGYAVVARATRIGLPERRRPSKWPDAMDARGRELWAARVLSASLIAEQINKEFDETLTKNSVLGYAFRNWPKRPRDISPVRSLPRVRKPRPTATIIPFIKRLDIPESLHKTLMDLNRGECRFPDDDVTGGILFCGHPIADGHPSYCPGHFHLSIDKKRRRSKYAEAA